MNKAINHYNSQTRPNPDRKGVVFTPVSGGSYAPVNEKSTKKQAYLKGLEESYRQSVQHEQGKITLQSMDDFLNEL
jgi:hypothetical protein